MKICLKSAPNKIYTVYGVYWAIYYKTKEFQRHHFIINKSDEFGGFSILREENVDIIDSSLSHFIMRKDKDRDILVHKAALMPEYLFLELVNHNGISYVDKLFQNMNDLSLEEYG